MSRSYRWAGFKVVRRFTSAGIYERSCRIDLIFLIAHLLRPLADLPSSRWELPGEEGSTQSSFLTHPETARRLVGNRLCVLSCLFLLFLVPSYFCFLGSPPNWKLRLDFHFAFSLVLLKRLSWGRRPPFWFTQARAASDRRRRSLILGLRQRPPSLPSPFSSHSPADYSRIKHRI